VNCVPEIKYFGAGFESGERKVTKKCNEISPGEPAMDFNVLIPDI
jgi:hypothetical protein